MTCPPPKTNSKNSAKCGRLRMAEKLAGIGKEAGYPAQNAYHNAESRAGRDIAPGCAGSRERTQCGANHAAELDLEKFLRTYFPRPSAARFVPITRR